MATQADDAPLIVVEDVDAAIEHHPEDWLAFALFWLLALVVFAQFFTRYILNDSLAWTEEVARYLLMWVTFIGAAVPMRRRTHIAVEVLHQFLPERLVRPLRAAIDAVTLGFLGCLAWFSILILERMQIQRMTIIDLPMSWVYGGIAVGVFIMLLRALQVAVQNLRRGWRAPEGAHTLMID
ncbi:MAG: TRAP transporter small permease [Alphaproteobacteria bacterium]|nr:TRAP transporter small permease [Alphaproteobacteria bacterium]